MSKFINAAEAAKLVKDNDTLIVAGFGSYASPEELMQFVAKRYEEEGHPAKLTVACGITPGDKTESTEPGKGMDLGLNRMKAPGRAWIRILKRSMTNSPKESSGWMEALFPVLFR